jgi:hypothetical protein
MGKLLSRLSVLMVLLAIAGGVGFAMNPSEDDHKAKLYAHLQKKVSGEGILVTVGAELAKRAGALDLAGLEYHNYIAFSTMKRNGEVTTLGAFGMIFILNDNILPGK